MERCSSSTSVTKDVCRLCLKALGRGDSFFMLKDSLNVELREKISAVLTGSRHLGGVVQCSSCSSPSDCPKPWCVCVRCKLDLDFFTEFANRAKTIAKRLDAIKCSSEAKRQCRVGDIRSEVQSSFPTLYGGSRPHDSSGSSSLMVLHEVMTRDGKVAIPRLPPKRSEAKAKVAKDRSQGQLHPCTTTPKRVKNFICSVDGCSKKFFDRPALFSHLSHYHRLQASSPIAQGGIVSPTPPGGSSQGTRDGGKPFACSHSGCTKNYRSKHYLVEHERTHTGEKPFICKVCGRGFFRVLDLKKHTLLKICKVRKR